MDFFSCMCFLYVSPPPQHLKEQHTKNVVSRLHRVSQQALTPIQFPADAQGGAPHVEQRALMESQNLKVK